MKKVFYETQKYGKLYIDKILFETYLPILFTCKNDMNDIFICVCCQDNENGKKWLISETDGKVIVELLQNKLSIREAFLKNVGLKLSIFLMDKIIEKNMIIQIGHRIVFIYLSQTHILMQRMMSMQRR